jgi:hypothetical protein
MAGRLTKDARLRSGCVFGDQPISAVAGSRGNAWNMMSSTVRRVSDQIGASTPRMSASVTAGRVTPPEVRDGM